MVCQECKYNFLQNIHANVTIIILYSTTGHWLTRWVNPSRTAAGDSFQPQKASEQPRRTLLRRRRRKMRNRQRTRVQSNSNSNQQLATAKAKADRPDRPIDECVKCVLRLCEPAADDWPATMPCARAAGSSSVTSPPSLTLHACRLQGPTRRLLPKHSSMSSEKRNLAAWLWLVVTGEVVFC